MPEGDTLRETARRLSALVGERLSVEARNPRSVALGVAPRLDGRRLEGVEAVGKNLLLSFEGGLVLRSHLRMKGRWTVADAAAPVGGSPWLVLRGTTRAAILWHGPLLELGRAAIARLGPDILDSPPDLDGMVARLRSGERGIAVGDALLDQRRVAGIGNRWRAEALHAAGVSPFRPLETLDDPGLRLLLAVAHEQMSIGRRDAAVYRRAGRPCPRCGTVVASRPQGEHARMAYWCPGCQV